MARVTRIVVIDDDPDFLDYVQIVLSANGYDVTICTTEERGIACIREHPPDLVIVDLMMCYEMGGLAVGEEMSCDPELSQVPLLLVSAIVSREDDALLARFKKTRLDAFMSKPVEPAALLRCVADLTTAA